MNALAPADPAMDLFREWEAIQANLERLEVELVPLKGEEAGPCEDAIDAAVDRRHNIQKAIAIITATTVAGAVGKLRIAHAELVGWAGLDEHDGRMLLATIHDLDRLAAGGGP